MIDPLRSLRDSSQIAELALVVATPEAFFALLRERDEVLALRRAFNCGATTAEHLKEFVSALLQEFKPTTRLPGDGCLCAIAVALATSPSPFAEKFLAELAELHVQEVPMSSRVARVARQMRRVRVTSNTTAHFVVADGAANLRAQDWAVFATRDDADPVSSDQTVATISLA